MEAFIIYLAKFGLCLGIFITVYALLLRTTTFYKLNRFFLLSGFLLSLLIPLIRYSYNVLVPSSVITADVITKASPVVASDSTIDVWLIFLVFYCSGALGLLIRNLLSYRRLFALVRNGIKSNYDNYKLIENKDVASPFTVFNYILLGSDNLSKAEKELILKHELVHVHQKHWIDLLFSECILAFQWFNPLAWLYVYLLKENHEFLADKAVIDSGVSPALYQAVLINQRFQAPVFAFSNSFNYPKPFSRLKMLKKSKSAPWRRFAFLPIIPVLSLFVWIFAEPNYVTSIGAPFFSERLPINGQFENEGLSKDKSEGSIVSKNVKAETKSMERKHKSISQAISPLYIVDGDRVNGIDNLSSEDIESMNVLKGKETIQLYGKGAENGVVVITTKGKAGLSVSGIQGDTKYVRVKEVAPNSIQKSGEVSVQSDNRDLNAVLFVVDGKIESTEKVKSMDPDIIESVEVLKNESARAVYGEKGKNGVVKVTTKKI